MKNVLKSGLVTIGAVLCAATSAWSASVTNSGSASIVLVVVEDGNRLEVPLEAGTSESICPTGCVITLTNGDRLGLQGGESVDIKDGVAIIN